MRSSLGSSVRDLRQQAGLTQQQAADLAGMSVGALRDLEQGRVSAPRAATLRRLAEALRLPVRATEELLRWAQPGQAPDRGLWLQLLGPLAVQVDGAVVAIGSARQRLLLGVLGLSPNTPVSQDALVETVWQGQPPENAAELLRMDVSRLRRRLRRRAEPDGPPVLAATAGGYQLTVSENQLDLLMFGGLADRARQAGGDGDPDRVCRLFDEAMSLWRGEPVADLASLRTHPAVAALSQRWRRAVVEYAETATAVGRHDQVLPLLWRVVEADPLHEAAHARLIAALAAAGQHAEASAVFEAVRHRLADQLGTDPGPELQSAHELAHRGATSGASGGGTGGGLSGGGTGSGLSGGGAGGSSGDEVAGPPGGGVGGDGTGGPEPAPVSAYRQLPPDLTEFTGRAAELQALHERLPSATSAGTAVVISSVEGMAGVGKTRLALHLAHQLLAAGRGTEIQLYVDLRGHADAPPADPAGVLASFLLLLGTPGDQIPADVSGRAALYRDRLFGRQALVLLDNAASEEQVRPLLPAGPTNLVLVTSRRSLALDGAQVLPLDVFPPEDARDLLALIAGPERVAQDPAAAERVAQLCGRLPLAVSLAARRLRARAGWRLADLADRLADAGDRLSELAAGSRQVQAVFELSYQALPDDARRMFRLLGLHPGQDFTDESAAALAGVTPVAARRLLDRLVDEHLATMVTGERYRLHDLLREYAGELAGVEEPEPARRAAVGRVLDYYLHTTARATDQLLAQRSTVDLVGAAPEHGPELPDRRAAVRWLDTERTGLLAAVNLAAEGWPTHAWQLAHELRVYLGMHGHIEDWVASHEVALRAVLAGGDRTGETHIRTFLGSAYLDLGRNREAHEHLSRALELHDSLPAAGEAAGGAAGEEAGGAGREAAADVAREGNIRTLLGVACKELGQFPEALRHYQRAADLCAGRDPYREAAARCNIGTLLVELDRLDEARDTYHRALTLTREVGDVDGESLVLSNLGDAYRRLGRADEALTYLERALAVADAHGFRPRRAYALHRLGNLYHAQGRLDEALGRLREAWQMLQTKDTDAQEESEILVDLGAVQRDAGAVDEAHELLRQGQALAAEIGSRYQQARALDGLAQLYQRVGDMAAAEQHRSRARTLYNELGVPEPVPAVTPPEAGVPAGSAATRRRG